MKVTNGPGIRVHLLVLGVLLSAPTIRAQDPSTEDLREQVEELLRRDAARERELQELRTRDAEKQQRLDQMSTELERLKQADQAASDPEKKTSDLEAALDDALSETDVLTVEPVPGESGVLAQVPLGGGTTLQLIDLSLDVMTSVGVSSEGGETLEGLQGHSHDPRRRGFNLQSVELSAMGAVDPYFDAEVHVLFGVEPDGGDTFTELEEAFVTTTALPYGLEVEAGQMLTEFGRINPQHPHRWDWLDAPIIQTRLLGSDGTRAPGTRIGWLTPLPWYSELHFTVQNADTEQMASFLGEMGHGHGDSGGYDDHGHLEGIGGGGVVDRDLHGLEELAYAMRWVNSWDLSDTYSTAVGVSGMYGPNDSGSDGDTFLYGADLLLKWRPANQRRGWPFVTWQTEFMGRLFHADSFYDEEDPADPTDDIYLPSTTLEDWGAYTQILWGCRRPWAVGARGEYALSASSRAVHRDDDEYRADRFRLSPMILYQPTEFSRLRLQYNFDQAKDLRHDRAHTLWLGLEVSFGAHPAHDY